MATRRIVVMLKCRSVWPMETGPQPQIASCAVGNIQFFCVQTIPNWFGPASKKFLNFRVLCPWPLLTGFFLPLPCREPINYYPNHPLQPIENNSLVGHLFSICSCYDCWAVMIRFFFLDTKKLYYWTLDISNDLCRQWSVLTVLSMLHSTSIGCIYWQLEKVDEIIFFKIFKIFYLKLFF